MKMVRLGKTELFVTKTAMGCLPIQRCTETEAVGILRRAYEGGVNFFDTARAYTDSEHKLGLAFSALPRERIVLATKSHGRTKQEILAHIETSLRELQTDYIDLFQFHMMGEMPDFNDPDGIYAGAAEAKARGWIRHIGVTAHKIDLAFDLVETGKFETMQFPFSYISGDKELRLVRRCKELDMGFIAMKGLSGGLLTNARACHAFMDQFDNVIPIWGVQTLQQIDQWLALSREEVALDSELRAVIEKDRRELAHSFCRGCGYCLPCPAGIEINNAARMDMLLTRSPWQPYMSQEWHAKMHLIENCQHCRQCASRCPYELDTPALLAYQLENYDRFYAEHQA